jgi:NADH-quinone oxidoreductase subunit L
MMLPLALLAIGALFAGYINFPTAHLGDFLGTSPSLSASYDMASAHAVSAPHLAEGYGQIVETAEHEPMISGLMIFSGLISLAGILAAFVLHLKNRPLGDKLAQDFGPVTRLLEAKYYVDEIYQAIIVNPLRAIGEFSYRFDRWIIDMLVNMSGWICQLSGYFLKFTTQRGYLQGYGAAMLLGIAVILLMMLMH